MAPNEDGPERENPAQGRPVKPGLLDETAGTRPLQWDWEKLNGLLRPRFLRIAARDYHFTDEEAEDILQTVYLRVLARDPRIQDPIAYLKVAFLNTCVNASIARAATRAHSGDAEQSPGPVDRSDERLLSRIHAVQVVNAAIRASVPKCRRIIRLYFGRELTLDEMARVTGYSRQTVWKRIWGCVRQIREALT